MPGPVVDSLSSSLRTMGISRTLRTAVTAATSLSSHNKSRLARRSLCTQKLTSSSPPSSSSLFTTSTSRSTSSNIRFTSSPPSRRCFSTTYTSLSWLQPKMAEKSKSRVGRPRMPTGGSMRGTTVVWGDYGLRMKDHDRRVSAKQLKIGEDTIRRVLKGENYKLYTRVSANIGVYTKGNEVRMGKGKGKFDYWAARVPVSRVVFEITGNMHEKVVREAFRLAGHKLPGLWEFVRKGDPPVVGITKLQEGITLESLKEARRQVDPKQNKTELEERVDGKGKLDDVMVTTTMISDSAPKTVSSDATAT